MRGRARGGEEAAPVGVRHQLGAGLAAAIGIVAAEGVVLAVAPQRAIVGIALVAGDDDHGFGRRTGADGLEQMDRAHHVGGVGLDRIGIGTAHQRLCGHVDDDARAGAVECGGERVRVANIGDGVVDVIGEAGGVEQALGFRRKGVAVHLGAQAAEQARRPGTLEAGMPGEKDAPALPQRRMDHHTLHCGVSPAHSSSRKLRSRSVSMGCQKPRWI